MDRIAQLASAITSKRSSVAVMGLGYVGLPIARLLVDAGFRVWGLDTDPEKVSLLQDGKSYIGHVPEEWIASSLAGERLHPTCDMSALSRVDVVVICVPTPLSASRDPDLSFVTSTAEAVSQYLRPGQLIVLESTSYPGTTREVVLPILERSGLQAGRDYFLAYGPEREDPGNCEFSTRTIPKLVGGIDPPSRELAASFYGQVFETVVPVGSCEIAEAAKLLENTYRAVNIALVNELKLLFARMDIDVWEVIEAAKTKPFGFQAFYPGPGLGGHCIPVDPFYLSWLARRHGGSARFIELAGEVNRAMPAHVYDQIAQALNQHGKPIRGSRVCLLGAAYKRDVDDPRESPAFPLLQRLLAGGAQATYSDPHIPRLPKMRHYDLPEMTSQSLTREFLEEQDCVVVVTDHSAFNYRLIARHAPLIVDARNTITACSEVVPRVWKA